MLRKEIEKELAEPSKEFVRMMAVRLHDGKITASVKENFSKMVAVTISATVKDLDNERLSSALKASSPTEAVWSKEEATVDGEAIITTEEAISGYRIVQAIASKLVVIRDAKSYCAILLDDNNRKTIARMDFNGLTAKYLGTFTGKDEQQRTGIPILIPERGTRNVNPSPSVGGGYDSSYRSNNSRSGYGSGLGTYSSNPYGR